MACAIHRRTTLAVPTMLTSMARSGSASTFGGDEGRPVYQHLDGPAVYPALHLTVVSDVELD